MSLNTFLDRKVFDYNNNSITEGREMKDSREFSRPLICSGRAISSTNSFFPNYQTLEEGDDAVDVADDLGRTQNGEQSGGHPGGAARTSATLSRSLVNSSMAFAPSSDDAAWKLIAKFLCLVFLFPCIGAFFALFSLANREDSKFLRGHGEWRVLFTIGVVLQLSVACPLMFLIDTSAHAELSKLPTHGDFYVPFFTYPAVCAYFVMVAWVFYGLRFDEDVSRHEKRIEEEKKMLRMRRVNVVMLIKKQLRDVTSVRTEPLLLVGVFVALMQVVFMRSCVWVVSRAKSDGFCTGDRFLLLSYPAYYENNYVWIVTVYWFLMFFVIDSVTFFAVLVYYQELRQVTAFTMMNRTGSVSSISNGALGESEQQRRGLIEDLYEPRNLATWAAMWQQLVQEVKSNPVSESLRSTTFFANCVVFLGSLSYLGIRNITSTSHVAEFTNSAVAVGVISLFGIFSFVYVTAKLQSAIETHEATVSQVANDCQVTLMMRRHDAVEARHLHGKVVVLQALDQYNRSAPTYPKLIGLSLETLRWGAIIMGLVLLNVFFLFLYVVDCLQHKQKGK